MQTNVAVKIEAKNLSAMTKSRRLWCLGVLATLFGCASHPGIMFRKNLNAGVYKSLDQCMSAALEVMSQRLSKYDAVSNHHSNRRDCYYRFGMYAEGQEELRLSLEMGRIESVLSKLLAIGRIESRERQIQHENVKNKARFHGLSKFGGFAIGG